MTSQTTLIDRTSLAAAARAAQLSDGVAKSTPQATVHPAEPEQAVATAHKLIRYGAEHEIEMLKSIVETGDLPRSFRYRAFISYSRQDRRAAERVHNSIENYRIPKELVGRAARDGPIPNKIYPVFRDRDELACAPDLSASIREALEQSAYLVVLCSPSAARSRWVNREIIHFKKLGRADRIHALIIEGEPNAESPDEECYPSALRFRVGPKRRARRASTCRAVSSRPSTCGRRQAKRDT